MMTYYRIPRSARQVAGGIWCLASALHRRWRARRRSFRSADILVVGSLRAGGSGKTDWVDWIASRHPELAILVHPTGDEDAWLERRHPGKIFRHRDLVDAARDARDAGFRCAVSDGGLQDPALDRNPALLLGERRAPLEQLHPFGPFREMHPARSVDLALQEADWSWRFAIDLPRGSNVLVAASVARSGKVAEDLGRMGYRVVARLPARDHRSFSRRAVRNLEQAHPGVPWVITEKDAAAGRHGIFRSPCHVFHRALVVPDAVASSVDALVPRSA